MNNLMRRNFMGGKKEADPTESFIITVSVGAGETFTLPLLSTGTYNFDVLNWGDGISDIITTYNQAEVTHTYTDAGTYDIEMNGLIVGWSFGFNNVSRLLITDIKQFGGINGVVFDINADCFSGCTNLDVSATDLPNLQGDSMQNFFLNCSSLVGNSSFNSWYTSNVINMNQVFRGCSQFNQNIGYWDISNVTTMFGLFLNATNFNNGGSSDINNWNTSNVTDMLDVFRLCSSFNQPVGNWDVGQVTRFQRMFDGATIFNQDLSAWRPVNGTIFNTIFRNSAFNNGGSSLIDDWRFKTTGSIDFRDFFENTPFNQPIENWNVANVTDMRSMFSGANDFNQPLNNWERIDSTLSNVGNMVNMFNNANSFNQNIGSWDVSGVTNFGFMFNGASSFNNGGSSDINNWVTSSSTDMRFMFGNSNFNQNIESWNTSNVTIMQQMFRNTPFNQDISAWNVSNVTNMIAMFFGNTVFNQPIGNWTTSSLQDIRQMFDGASNNFDQDLSNWDVTNITSALDAFQFCTFSTANYDAILIGWEAQAVQNNIDINFGINTTYTLGGAAETARNNLINDHNWTITDGGSI